MTHEEIPALYGSLVFNDKVMRNKLPKDMYKALRKTIENGTHLEVIQHGILHHQLSLKMVLYIFRRLSVLTAVRHWIRKPHCSVPWKH